jgi:hypothetical protein
VLAALLRAHSRRFIGDQLHPRKNTRSYLDDELDRIAAGKSLRLVDQATGMLGKLAFRRKFQTKEETLSSSFHVDFFGAEAGILRAGNFTRIYCGFFGTSLFQTRQT